MKLDSTISALLLWTAGECMATGWCGRMEADNHHGSSPSKRRPEIIKEHCDHRKRRWFLSMWLCWPPLFLFRDDRDVPPSAAHLGWDPSPLHSCLQECHGPHVTAKLPACATLPSPQWSPPCSTLTHPSQPTALDESILCPFYTPILSFPSLKETKTTSPTSVCVLPATAASCYTVEECRHEHGPRSPTKAVKDELLVFCKLNVVQPPLSLTPSQSLPAE